MSETERIIELRELLHKYNNLYYVQNAPVISDIEFDQLMHELIDLEEKHPELYDRIIAEGHQVGNHTHNHMVGLTHTIKEYSYNVEKANAYIHSHYVRPPHGWMRLAQYAWLSRKYKIVMWDLVTRDYSKWMTADDILNNIKKYARNGSIITFHDSLKSIDKLHTALPTSLQWLRDQGYEFKIFP